MQKNCAYCQQPFAARHSTRKYCSDTCKQMAYYQRNGFVAAGHSGLGVSLRQGDNVKYAMQEQEARSLQEENSLLPPSANKTGADRTVKYEWIESSFLQRVESHFYTLHHLSGYLRPCIP